jgi:hypothetical protein
MKTFSLVVRYGDHNGCQDFDMGSLGDAAAAQDERYILHFVKEWFDENPQLTGTELIRADITQALLNNNLLPFHTYRLEQNGSTYTLRRYINGKVEDLISFSLPKNWWDVDEGYREEIVSDLTC